MILGHFALACCFTEPLPASNIFADGLAAVIPVGAVRVIDVCGPGQSIDQRTMTDAQKGRFAALQGAWLAMREKRRRPETAAELDAAIMEFLKLHRAETDTVVL
jgi:hypothetical protein